MAGMSAIDWAKRPLQRYAKFFGRAPRAEFWWFTLFVTMAWIVIAIAFAGPLFSLAMSGAEPSAGVTGAIGFGSILILIFWLAMLLPTLAVQVRRLHDTDRSGWWAGALYILYAIVTVLQVAIAGSTMAAEPTGGTLAMAGALGILSLVMMIYGIVLIVFYCLPGTRGPNRFGPDPYGTENLDEVFS